MPKAIFHVRNSKITNPKVLRKLFDELKDGIYTCDVMSNNKRSLSQNAYLHGVVIPLVLEGLREAGFEDVRDADDAKDVIKGLFLKKKVVNRETGEVLSEIIKDTSDLTTIEMIDFIDEVVRWAAEYLSIHIPAPNSQSTIFSNE